MMIHLSNVFHNKQNQVIFYTTWFNKNNFSEKINFPLEVINFRFKIISYIYIAYKIRNSEIIFAWNSPMHFVWVFSKIFFRSKAKVYWWNHHYPWYYEKKHSTLFVKIKMVLEKFAIKYIDQLVANSKYIKNSLEEIFWLKQVEVLYPCLREIFYDITLKEDNTKTKINIFTYSRWVKWKNIKLIFDVYDRLSKTYDFNLIIAWEGVELNYFKNKYSQNENIKFLWLLYDSDVIENLLKADIFLFPSLIDSFGMVILEAMFAWLPIVWFDSWWVSELIRDNQNGFLVKSENDFIEKTETLLKDDILRKRFSKNSLSISKSDFSKDMFEKQLEEILS